MLPVVTLVRVMMRKCAKFGFGLNWVVYLLFSLVAEALTLKALITLLGLVRALKITSYFALGFSLPDRYHYLRVLPRAPLALYRTLEYC